jgi:hypothetical protein
MREGKGKGRFEYGFFLLADFMYSQSTIRQSWRAKRRVI